MHRSSSATRVADDYYKGLSSFSIQGGSTRISLDPIDGGGGSGGGGGDEELPIYSSTSHYAKKDRSSRFRSAENAVHLIPLVLVICAIILWFFSNPVELIRQGDQNIVARTETLEGGTKSVTYGTHDTLTSRVELEHVDPSTMQTITNNRNYLEHVDPSTMQTITNNRNYRR